MDLKERLFKAIKEHWPTAELHNDQVQLADQTLDLTALLRLPQRILNSTEFTHLPPLFDASENFPIADMYVELMVAKTNGVARPFLLQQGRTIADEQETRRQQYHSRHLNIHQCINMPQHQHIVILGDPGSGKTSLLKYLCLELASGKSQRWLIPAFISLRRYWFEKQKNPSMTLLHYSSILICSMQNQKELLNQLSLFLHDAYRPRQEKITSFETTLQYLSGDKKEHILFLLDGLDEVATNQEAIQIITEDIRELSRSFSWILTSRHTGFFGDLGEDICYEIMQLNKAGIEKLVESWFINSKLEHKKDEQDNLLKQIDANPRLLDMASNPFLLTLLCNIKQYSANEQLPIHRTDVYASIIKLIRLQLRNIKKDNNLFREQEMVYLAKFCHYLYTDAEYAPLQLFEYDHWDCFALPDIPPKFDEHFLPSRLINSWAQGGDFHFIHLTFQEYFIALHIANHSIENIRSYLFSPHWKMIFRFLAGIYGKQTNKEKLKKLLLTLLHPTDNLGILYLEAARFLIEANIEDSTELLGYDIRKDLWELWIGKSDYVKESAGEVLAILSPNYLLQKIVILTHDYKKFKSDYNAWKSISLLGFIQNNQADQLIIKYLQVDSKKIQKIAIEALAQKNTKKLRQIVIDLCYSNPEKHFDLLCSAAKATKHKDFIDYLTPYLKSVPISLSTYDNLFQALIALGTTEFSDDLISLIQSYPMEELTDSAIEAILALQTTQSINWLNFLQTKANSKIKISATSYALKYNLFSRTNLLNDFKNSDSKSLRIYLATFLNQAQQTGKIEKDVIPILLAIVASDTQESPRALTIIEQTDFNSLLDEHQLFTLANLSRDYIDHPDIELAMSAISILGRLIDLTAYLDIKNLALHGNKLHTQPCAISALGNYKNTFPDEVKKILHTLYLDFYDTNDYVKRDILTTLAAIDLREILPYLDDQDAQETMTSFCARAGVLLFEDGYIDRLGKYHLFKQTPTKLNIKLPAKNQLETLRAACNYALENKLIIKTSAKRDGLKPLFTKIQAGINENKFEYGVDLVTGNKFLAGEQISDESAQKIMNRLQVICPDLFQIHT